MLLQTSDGGHLLHLFVCIADYFIQSLMIFAIEKPLKRRVPSYRVLVALFNILPSELNSVFVCLVDDVQHLVRHVLMARCCNFVVGN